ncbi:TPA: hypothetical protein N0F65_010765, partial [Lagenidium giganteum]
DRKLFRRDSLVLEDSDVVDQALVSRLPPVAPGSSRLFLCRHGQTDYNLKCMFQGRGVNTVLNDTGILQANFLARAMRNVPLSAIYSSTLNRAKETAMIVAQYHPTVKMQHFRDLEEMSFGKFEGNARSLFHNDLHAIYDQWELGHYDHSFPDGECPLDVAKRGVAQIDALMQASLQQDNVLIVTHGRFNKVVLARMLDGGMENMQALPQDNTCVNVVDFDHASHSYTRVELNNTEHLPSLLNPQ